MNFDLKKKYSIRNNYKLSNKKLEKLITKMLLIRKVEEKICHFLKKNEIKTPCHLSIGQEAIAVGVANYFKSGDSVFSTHRSHAHYLAFENDIEKFVFEIFGFSQGSSKGMGGSMHLYSKKPALFHSLPIVGGTIPISLGSGLYYKLFKKKKISYCFFGDGASEEGVFHESLNLASIYNLPVIFICENNLYSSHLDIKYRQPFEKISRFALPNNIKKKECFGNNILDVMRVADMAQEYVRKYQKPYFIEFLTYRLVGHVGYDKNIDVGVRRSEKELNFWMNNDPIKLLKQFMLKYKNYKDFYFDDLDCKVEKKVNNVFKKVIKLGKKPTKKFLMKFERGND